MRRQWNPLTEGQTRAFVDARQYAEAHEAAVKYAADFTAWLYFKRYPNGVEYLYRANDRRGRGTTQGRRSPETEALLHAYKAKQAEAKLRLKIARDNLVLHARFCKAARINRIPRHAAAIIRAFAELAPQLTFVVVGTYALYAYEGLCDVQFLPNVMETQDLDVLWDSGHSLLATVAAGDMDAFPEVLEVLRSVDSTYTRNEERTFQARNAAGFAVDFLTSDGPPLKASDRIHPISTAALAVLSAATINETVIDQDGMPLKLRVPDPRIYAAHKLWLAERKDRRPGKRDRDRAQGEALREVLHDRQPVLEPLPALPLRGEFDNIAKLLQEDRFEEQGEST